MDTPFAFPPIGIVRSCFPEKFGIPRQAGLAPDAEAVLELLPPWDRDEAVRGLEDCSHLWLVFLFHEAMDRPAKPTVRPPRLGGNRRVGVFATRSPFRPNPIGLSAVELVGIERRDGRLCLLLRGADLLDGTPVLDIKPYVPYADSIPQARAGIALEAPPVRLQVAFSPEAEGFLAGLPGLDGERMRRLVVQVLGQDPRPAYLEGSPTRTGFGVRLGPFNVRWSVRGDLAEVERIEPEEQS